ncbi:hypothetical protein FDG2_0075 [Candidatus Protofrankia californiensis]|uniref:Uncharacterized protein n=1 Tax=Candidatus Protofrankia californiensis TaxID=1839754 RepID=A0A1C3NSX6_9ACTN|nr:hypothetical protein FDG2_0075 [Candidatus Protofrankia californiensis]
MTGSDEAGRRPAGEAMTGASGDTGIPAKPGRGEHVYSVSYVDGAGSVQFAVFVRLEEAKFSERRQADRTRAIVRILEWILDDRRGNYRE